jgi:phosphoribosyl 1,2-cyclic phosphodiesterase
VSGVRFISLASGSKGNCYFLATPHAQVLLDCGLGVRALGKLLAELRVDWRGLDAVFITHTHTDHIRGLGVLLKHVPTLRVYAHERLAAELSRLVHSQQAGPGKPVAGAGGRRGWPGYGAALTAGHGPAGSGAAGGLGNGHAGPGAGGNENGQPAPHGLPMYLQTFRSQEGFNFRDLDVLPVEVSHDCEPTTAFKIYVSGARLGLLTDLGTYTDAVRSAFNDCDALVLESNHCLEMLRTGPYPESLKARIRSSKGHLSNDQAVEFATGLNHLPSHLLLGHLSEQNNTPAQVHSAFTRIELGALPHTVLTQHAPGPLVEL